MITFEISGELELFQRTAREFAQTALRPAGRGAEASGTPLAGLREAYLSLGFAGLSLPEVVGGLGQGLIAQVIVEEELAAGDLPLALAMPGPGAFGVLLTALGTESQAQRILGPMLERGARGAVAWVDQKPRVGTFAATAVEGADGNLRLNGTKTEVRLGHDAEQLLVFARLESKDGAARPAAFVVPAAEGQHKGGLRIVADGPGLAFDAAKGATVTFEDVWLPPEARLSGADSSWEVKLFDALGRLAVISAARGVGLARAAAEHAQAYAADRQAFGKPIAHFQAIAFLIADLMTKVEVMRGLVHRAAFAFDHQEPDALRRAAFAIAEAHEGAMVVTNQAVQVLGGAGFVQDYPVEKWMREAKAHMAAVMPHAVADLLVGRLALEGALTLAADAPLPELQSIWL